MLYSLVVQGSCCIASLLAVGYLAAAPKIPSISRPNLTCVSVDVHHFKNFHASSGCLVCFNIIDAEAAETVSLLIVSPSLVPGTNAKSHLPLISGANTASVL